MSDLCVTETLFSANSALHTQIPYNCPSSMQVCYICILNTNVHNFGINSSLCGRNPTLNMLFFVNKQPFYEVTVVLLYFINVLPNAQ